MRKSVEKHLTLREKILETIRDAIIAGALKPGEKVAEPELEGIDATIAFISAISAGSEPTRSWVVSTNRDASTSAM